MNGSVKEAMREIVEQLPDECTWDDVMYRVYVRQKIQAGLDDEAGGRVLDHEDVFAEYSDVQNSVDESGA